MRTSLAAVALLTSSACGTYSLVRSADTLQAGQVEAAGGLAASHLGEVNTVIHAAVGVSDDVEVLAQNEVWNAFVEARYGILHTRDDGFALAVGAGGGTAVTVGSILTDAVDDDDNDSGGAALGSVSVGKQWDSVALTLGNRTFVRTNGDYLMSSTRAQLRIGARRVGVIAEAGGTAHVVTSGSAALFLAEAMLGVWVGF